ncbi:Rieske (2Fe-2S) protein [Polymorphospora sp. NPDC050346]|uniref:Rieske (2Fe-2S) protein n=1 Tax=Polymorphospora sp. NPDC050346 TaxID=3155780 RepID=UPI0033CB4D7E
MSDDQVVTGPGSTTRRSLFAGAGAVGATVVLAACGGDDGSPDGGTSTPGTAPTGGGDTGGGVTLGSTADVPVGGGVIFAAQQVVVTQPAAGEFKAFSSICTHQQCPVSRIEGGMINCTCHNSRFSIEDGAPQGGPATAPLQSKTVTVQGDNIVLG